MDSFTALRCIGRTQRSLLFPSVRFSGGLSPDVFAPFTSRLLSLEDGFGYCIPSTNMTVFYHKLNIVVK